jgi:hypothetical protein
MRSSSLSEAETLMRFSKPVPEMGRAVYKVTAGPKEHKHAYYCFCPWSPDGRLLLLARYDRVDPEAEICVMDTQTGRISVAGHSRDWNAHSVAFQQWQGPLNRIFYVSCDDSGLVLATVNPDGSSEKILPADEFSPEIICSPDGRWAYAGTSLKLLFPNDSVAPRHDKGLLGLNLETGERKMLLSMEQAAALIPNAGEAASWHLYAKRIVAHPRLPKLFCNITNTFWDRDGREPRIRCLIVTGTDGSGPVYVGGIVHHPNWHPREDRIVANLTDFNGVMRFGLYRGDGSGLVEYVPSARGSGHPSYSPDGRWLCTDASGPRGNRMILCDPVTGREIVIMEYESGGEGGYASFKAIDSRAGGETVMDALRKVEEGAVKVWQTQCHPAWSRDGSAILFNADRGQGSQVFMVDVKRALEIM